MRICVGGAQLKIALHFSIPRFLVLFNFKTCIHLVFAVLFVIAFAIVYFLKIITVLR